MQIAKRKVLNFKRRHTCDPTTPPISLIDPLWSKPERIVARRASPYDPGWEVLVKWQGLGYEHATWEAESDPFLATPACAALAKELWERQTAAFRRSLPKALESSQSARIAARGALTPMTETRASVAQGGILHPHQLEAINWLREQWSEGNNAILGDEAGLGKSATVLSFLSSLREDFGCPGPMLIVAPAAALPYWEGECVRWLEASRLDIICYQGSVGARTVLFDHELWLQPTSLDGRGVHKALISDRVPKPDIIITSHDVFAADAPELNKMRFEVVIMDERHRVRSSLSKAHSAMMDVTARYRLALSGPGTVSSVDELMTRVSFLQPQYQSLNDLPGSLDEKEVPAQLTALRQLCDPVTMARSRSVVGPLVTPPTEVRLSVELCQEQVAAYKSVLVRAYELLADPKPSRFSGYRATQLKSVAAELRKACCHPLLVKLPGSSPGRAADVEQLSSIEAITAGSPKVALLDGMLRAFLAEKKKVLVFAHSTPILDLLQRCITLRFGSDSCARVDEETLSSDRRDAIASFNDPGSNAFIFLMHPHACGLGTDIPSIDSVVFFDSDWNVNADLSSLAHALRVGSGHGESLKVFRLYCKGSIEEKILSLAEKMKGLEGSLRHSHGRAYSAGAKVFEDVLRFGAESMFSPAPAANESGGDGGSAAGQQQEDTAGAAGTPLEATLEAAKDGDKLDGGSSIAVKKEVDGGLAAQHEDAAQPMDVAAPAHADGDTAIAPMATEALATTLLAGPSTDNNPTPTATGDDATEAVAIMYSDKIIQRILITDAVAALAAHARQEQDTTAAENNPSTPCVLSEDLPMVVVVDLSALKLDEASYSSEGELICLVVVLILRFLPTEQLLCCIPYLQLITSRCCRG